MSYYQKMYTDFKKSFYLHATLGIIVSSCIGAAAAMVVLMKGHGIREMIQLFLITCVCMGFNTTVLSNLNPKIVFNSLLISIVLNTFLIILHLL